MDFSKVLGGALWWLQRMATARLALLYDRIWAGTLSSAADPTTRRRHASVKFIFSRRPTRLHLMCAEIYRRRYVQLTAGELLELLLQGDGGVVSAKHLCSQAVHQLLQVLVEDRRLQEGKRRGKSPTASADSRTTPNVSIRMFACSYVQSVEKVVPGLLVLQEQLKVFEDLSQNQQTLL